MNERAPALYDNLRALEQRARAGREAAGERYFRRATAIHARRRFPDCGWAAHSGLRVSRTADQ